MSSTRTPILVTLLVGWLASAPAHAGNELDAVVGDARAFYVELHQSPELSTHETRTAARLAGRLRALGYAVTEHVGGEGVVALLRNGAGPTILLRTELDALPVEEKTGLAYASRVRVKDDAGREVSVMHACGHDLHMASLVATAAILAHSKASWRGMLMLIGQPAEESMTGAPRMLADRLFERFGRPDVALALHVFNDLPAGQVGVGEGFRFANADSVRVTVFGKGGHGSKPEATIDPIPIAAKIVLGLQMIISRETKPGEPAVVTVGMLNAGTKPNIIADTAELQLTVRTYKPEVRTRILQSIARVARGEALASGAAREPLVDVFASTDAVYNLPSLAKRLRPVLERALGPQHVEVTEPVMGSEDFSAFTKAGVPSFYLSLGGAEPSRYAQAKASGEPLPSNHSSLFAPDVDRALPTAIAAEVALLRELLK